MKAKGLFMVMLLATQIVIMAQQPVLKKEYYDWLETTIKRTWYELGDGTYHGKETFYYESGKIAYTMNYVKGIVTETKSFYEDGLPLMEVRRNNEGLYEGNLMYYQYSKGNHFLKAKAVARAGIFSEFTSYRSKDDIEWSYTNDGSIKEYREYENKIPVTILKFSNGHITGNIKDKAVFNDNHVQQINEPDVRGELKENVLHMINNDSNWESYRIKVYDNQCDLKEEFLTAHPLMGQMFEMKLQIIKKNGMGTEVVNNAHEWQYSHYYSTFSDINKLINYLLEQYVWDGKAIQSKDGKVMAEAVYDKGKLVSQIEYGKNGEVSYELKDNVRSWFNPDKTLKHREVFEGKDKIICVRNYNHGIIQTIDTLLKNVEIKGKKYEEISRIQQFDENGKIAKEVLNYEDYSLKYKIFDSNGNVVDSDDMRDELDSLFRRGGVVSVQAEDLFSSIIEKMHSFCLDEQGALHPEFVNQNNQGCYNKKIKNVYDAIQIVYQDFLNSAVAFNPVISEKHLNDPFYSDSFETIPEQIAFQKERVAIYNDILKICSSFNTYIGKFQEIVNAASEELDKQLKKKTDVNEIKSLMGLQKSE